MISYHLARARAAFTCSPVDARGHDANAVVIVEEEDDVGIQGRVGSAGPDL